METKHKNEYLPDWQLTGKPITNIDNELENESGEDDEYNFYHLAGNDHNIREMEKRG